MRTVITENENNKTQIKKQQIRVCCKIAID